MASETRISTGTVDFSGGVDSQRVPTIASQQNPNGLRPNQLAWGQNITVRGGGVASRGGWVRLGKMPFSAWFQEAQMYEPDTGHPYIIAQIGGRTFKVDVDTFAVTEITVVGDPNPSDRLRSWMCQGEQFMIIQDGDSLPLFWDGATLRRSRGASGTLNVTAADFTVPAIGSFVDVTLTAPYAGSDNSPISIAGKRYLQVLPANFITLETFGAPAPIIIPEGTQITTTPASGSNTIATTIALANIPSLANQQVILFTNRKTPYPGFVGQILFMAGRTYKWISSGHVAPAANHVFLVNIDDTAGNTQLAGANLAGPPELPAASPMDYYMGRLWLASGRDYVAGDIVGGPSGTAFYKYKDSILKMSENLFISEGGVFTVPTKSGNITALKHAANLDTALGEGVLYPFTRNTVYSTNVVPTRSEWQTLTEPIQRVAQISYGTTSDRSVVAVNGDLFCQAIDGVRSFLLALRYFGQWGNKSISSELQRVFTLNTQDLLNFGSGVELDNRLLETCLPFETPIGVAHRGIAALDFDPMSTLQEQRAPAWDGVLSGVNFLRIMASDFDGERRAFAMVASPDNEIEVWELTRGQRWDTNEFGETRINWVLETPSYTWDKPFEFKELDTMELWMDQIAGTVDVAVYFRPDQHPCWEFWHRFQLCAPRDNCEVLGVDTEGCYPTQQYQPQYKIPIVLPKPPLKCEFTQSPGRPMNVGCAFQFKIVVVGAARLRGLTVHAFPKMREPYLGMRCS